MGWQEGLVVADEPFGGREPVDQLVARGSAARGSRVHVLVRVHVGPLSRLLVEGENEVQNEGKHTRQEETRVRSPQLRALPGRLELVDLELVGERDGFIRHRHCCLSVCEMKSA